MLFYTKVLKSGDRMKKGNIKLLILQLVLLIFLLFNSFVFKIANQYILFGILTIFTVLSIFMIGYEKDNFRNKKDIFFNILIILLVYYFTTYILGIFVGFLKNGYSLSIRNIFLNTFSVILIITISEFLRYILLCKCKTNKVHIVLNIIIFILIDVNMKIGNYELTSMLGLTKMACLVIFPSITKNLLMTYLSVNVGYKNNLFYRYVTELSVYLFPLFPDFGDYIDTVLKIVLPVIILVKVNNLYSYFKERRIINSHYNKRKLLLYSAITIVLFAIVMLTSGLFSYQLIAVGSDSMKPKISMGDTVIVKKVKAYDVKKGDILIFKHDNKIIIHRVIKILNIEDKLYFVTKGDSNEKADSYVTHEDDVIGISKFKIKYIGIPTVELNKILER